jgi:hypothetical protein
LTLTEKRSLVDLDETDKQKRLRNKEIMILELGKGHRRESQRRGLSPNQEHLPALIYTGRPSSESQYSADHDDEVEEIRLQARLANKARKRAEILKEIERLGLTEQITLPPLETATPATSLSPASKEKFPASPNADIARDAQGGRKKLRKKRGLPSLLSPKPEALSKKEFSNSPPNQSLGSKASGALRKLRGTLSPPFRPSTPARTEPLGTDPSVVDMQKKIELAREARRNLVAAAKRYEASPRSSSPKSPCNKEVSTPADLERKIEIAKGAQRRSVGIKARVDLPDSSNETSKISHTSSPREEVLTLEIDTNSETEKKIELARDTNIKVTQAKLSAECSAHPNAATRKELHTPEFDNASDTQRKIELGREVRRRWEEEKAKGILIVYHQHRCQIVNMA